jgi:amidase
MNDIDALLDTHDTIALAELVRAGEVTGRELVEASIRRIEERNSELNAVVNRRFTEALADADAVDRSAPLAGVPFLVKDLNCDVAGLASTRGSRLFADVVASEDCELTIRFKAAGLIIVGNTNTPEFGKNASTEPALYGPTHNPWNLDYSPGGSSGGSAAAVAGGMVTAAHANDGGGSIRIPAAECGLVVLKPTRGRTPTWPIPASFAYPVGVGNCLTRTVRDSAAILDAISGPLPGDPYPAPPAPEAGSFLAALGQSPGALRIGFSAVMPNGEPVHGAGIAAIERTAAVLEALGHHLDEAKPEWEPRMPANAVSTAMGINGARQVIDQLARLGRSLAEDDLEVFTREMHDRSVAKSGIDLSRALQQIEITSRDVARFYENHDLWLTVTLGVPVPPLGWLDTSSIEAMFTRGGAFSALTALANATGQPAISVPAGFDENGLPVGIQLMARHCDEQTLLQVAAQLEQAQPWPLIATRSPAN